MIGLENALEITADHLLEPAVDVITLTDALGRILAEDIRADRDIPPFNRSAMDGYACRKQDLGQALEVKEMVRAGSAPGHLIGEGECARIMTGGIVPGGADCVIRQEDVEILSPQLIRYRGSSAPSHISWKGEDLRKGDLVTQAGTRIGPQHMGLLAAFGKVNIQVASRFRIGVMATGDELVEPHEKPAGAQIRNSNGMQLCGSIHAAGHLPRYLGLVPDDMEESLRAIENGMDGSDLLLLTGGASVGEFDLVGGALREHKFTIAFEEIAIQPGKPFTFATRGRDVCMGLSGNPVSCFVQFELLVRPYLMRSAGALDWERTGRMELEHAFERRESSRQLYLPGVSGNRGRVRLAEYHGSGHLHAVNRMNCLVVIPPGINRLEEGERVDVRFI